MNKQRRKEITRISDELENLKTALEQVQNEEQDYYDAMPEAFQSGEKGDAAQSAIDLVEEAFSALNEAIGQLSEI